MEAEELRYEKEVLEWKLQEAAGSRYAPQALTPSIWPGRQPGIGPMPAFNGTIERAIQAKHVSIYPSMNEVRFGLYLQFFDFIVALCWL